MKTSRLLNPPQGHPVRSLAAALAISCLFAIAPVHAQDKNNAIAIDEIALDKPDFSKFLNTTPKTVLKGVTKIAIPMFAVETVVKTGAGIRRETGEGSVAQNVTYLLDGVPQKDMQAAVDKLYDSLVTDLKALGIDVVSPEQVIASAAYKKSAPSLTSPNKQEGNNAEAMVYAAKGLTLGLSNSRFIFNRAAGVSSGAGQLGALFSAAKVVGQLSSQVSDGGIANAISEELGVPVLMVQLPLEFVEQTTKSSGGILSGTASAEVHSRLRLSISNNAFVAVGRGNDYSSHVTTTPLILSGTPVQAVKDTSSVATNVGLGLLSMALGGKSSTRITEKTAEAHPTLYVDSVADGVGKFSKIIVAAVKAMQ
jgi:hypothetical protein